MIGRALNQNNDIFVEGGRIAIVRDGAEVVQHVRTRLLFYMGEWVLDNLAGVPYFEEIFQKPADLGQIEMVLKNEIFRTPGVNRIVSFRMSYEGGSQRAITVNCTAETDFGEINIGEVTING